MNRAKAIRRVALGLGLTLALLLLPHRVYAAKEGPIVLRLEARASENPFAPSALQLPELREDISRLCHECSFPALEKEIIDYGIVVEDTGLSWTFTVYRSSGELLKKVEWSGSLQSGLEKAIVALRTDRH